MAKIREWDTWEDHVMHRTESRIDIRLGKEVRATVKKRAALVGISMSMYVKECVRHFLRTHPEDADPRE